MSSPSPAARGRARRPKRALARLALTLLAVLSTTLASVPVTSAAPGDPNTVSGTVTVASTGLPLAGATVTVIDPITVMNVSFATTLADGSYEVTGVAAGDYVVAFSADPQGFATEYWDDEYDFDEATLVSVSDLAGAVNVDAAMAQYGTMSGTVTAESDGSLLAGIEVSATGDVNFGTTTAADGTWSLDFLSPGDYEVSFTDPAEVFAREYWLDSGFSGNATPLSVADGGDVTSVSPTLREAATVSGTVVSDADGQPIGAISIEVFSATGMYQTSTAADGTWTVDGIYPDDYSVVFFDGGNTYVDEYANDAALLADADVFSFAPGSTTTVDASLALTAAPANATISGTVTSDADGSPVADVDVFVEEPNGSIVGFATTAGDGSYTVTDIADGDYVLRFEHVLGSYTPEYYADAVNKIDAVLVTVSGGLSLSGLDASLAPVAGGGSAEVSGTVTADVGGAPIAGITVSLDDGAGGFFSALTANDGTYAITGVPDGTYAVFFADFSGSWQSEYWDDQPDVANADPVTVSGGADVAGIDAGLAAPPPPGSITGTVTDPAGDPLSGAQVAGQCSNCAGGSPWFFTTAGPDGRYDSGSIAAGDWVVEFRDPTGTHAGEYYDDQPSSAAADLVAVTSGAATANIDAELALAGSIIGTVTGPLGLPVNASVIACLVSDPNTCGFGSSTFGGLYTISGLRPGSYTVEAITFAEIATHGSPVAVAAGSTATADLRFTTGGRIAGQVTDASGDPLPGLYVSFQDDDGLGFGGTSTAADGTYVSPLLSANDFTVNFGDVEFYDDVPFTSAFPWPGDTVRVTNATLTDDIDAALDVGFIRGTVTSNGTPLAGVFVAMTGNTSASAVTAADGSYAIPAQPGDYRVSFSSPFHDGEYYNDVSFFDPDAFLNADVVVVPATGDVTGIDADLDEVAPPVAPPSGTTVAGGTTLGGVPSLAGGPLDVTHAGCAGGTVTAQVSDRFGGFVAVAMVEGPAGTFSASIDVIAAGLAGKLDVAIVEDCPDPGDSTVTDFNVYIDPAGTIVDQRGNPIEGATVTLMRDDPNTIPVDFAAVPDGSVVMDPTINTKNPDTTGADGAFRWDVVAGLWKVRATAPGCHAPGEPSTPHAETAELVVPPPRLGLVIQLECEPVCPSDGASDPFTDVTATSFARGDVTCIFGLGVTTGTSPTTYSPSNNVTREQMAAFLARMYAAITGEQAPVVATPFTDVSATSFAKDDIGRIFGLGITTGTSATTYSPGDNVTREQMAAFLARLFKVASLDGEAPVVATPFTDVSATSFAKDDIGRIFGLGITTGTSATTYSPGDNVTREQMAAFLARLYRAAY